MPSFNFQPQFANKVKRNTKPGTIRQERKNMKVGDMMHCFTGLRTRKCKKIISRKCVAIVDVEFLESGFLKLNGLPLSWYNMIQFMEEDGFTAKFSKQQDIEVHKRFYDFFSNNYGLPFRGKWYVWKKSALKKYGVDLTNQQINESTN